MESNIPKGDSSAAPRRIAILDDNVDLLTLMEDIFEYEGYDVDFINATGGAQTRIEKTNPDLIILDMIIETPDSGWQFLQKLKLSPTTTNIPVIVCSAAVDVLKAQKERLEKYGCQILAKPFEVDNLLQMVSTAMGEDPVVLSY